MFGAPCKVLSISDLTVFRVAETTTLKSAKVLSYSDLCVALYVLDLDYSLMLIKHTDLDLETVILLDRVQKHKPISAEAVKMLRSKQLVEGRKNALIVAKSIAQATEQEAEYSKAKGFSKEFCCNLILKALEGHEGLPKFKINQLLFEYLPQHLTEEQKDWKVSRLLTTLRDSGDIFFDTGKIWRKSK